jgi:hypothetical protein
MGAGAENKTPSGFAEDGNWLCEKDGCHDVGCAERADGFSLSDRQNLLRLGFRQPGVDR